MFNYRKVSIAAGVVWAVLAVGSVASAGAEFAAFTDSEKEEFLRTAKVVVRRGVGVGINNTEKVTLTGDGVTHDAHLQTVNIHKTSYRTNEGLELNFRDGYQFNVAAYKLDRLLGLNMVPVSIERKIAGTAGSLTWWVDDVLMMERDRYQKKMRVPPLKNAAWGRSVGLQLAGVLLARRARQGSRRRSLGRRDRIRQLGRESVQPQRSAETSAVGHWIKRRDGKRPDARAGRR